MLRTISTLVILVMALSIFGQSGIEGRWKTFDEKPER